MLAPGTLKLFQLPCVCAWSSACCCLSSEALDSSDLISFKRLLLWIEGGGEEELGHQMCAGLCSSAVAFGCVHGVRLSQSPNMRSAVSGCCMGAELPHGIKWGEFLQAALLQTSGTGR